MGVSGGGCIYLFYFIIEFVRELLYITLVRGSGCVSVGVEVGLCSV